MFKSRSAPQLTYLYLLSNFPNKVWPPEAFEEGAEFLESFSKSFVNAHGLRLKTAFAETLVHLLHPIGKVCK